MYEDSVSSSSSGRREAIRALSRAPSNSTFTMSSRSSSGSKEYCLPEADLPECRRPLSRFARPQKPSIDSVTEILPAGIAMMRQRQASKTTSNTDHMNTQQSTFDIPPVPGFSELINGTYDDGTAVFSNETKPSRFSSSRFQRSISQQFKSRTSYRSDVEAVNVPEEEQAIVLSLKVLRDKVNQLENAATERELYMMELEQKVKILESDNDSLQRRYRSDSALGLDDGDSDDSQGNPMAERTLTVQKNRLERNLRVASRQLEEANRKVSISETTTKNVAEERDQAVHQLGLAFVQQEKLKYEVNRLTRTNQDLATDLAQVNQHMNRLKELTMRKVQNAGPVGQDVNDYLFGNTTANGTSHAPYAEVQKASSATHQRSVSPLNVKKNSSRDVPASRRSNQSRPEVRSLGDSVALKEPCDFNDDTGIIQMPRRLFPHTSDEEHTQSTNVTVPKESEVADLRSKLEHKRKIGDHYIPRPRSSSASEAEQTERHLASAARHPHVGDSKKRVFTKENDAQNLANSSTTNRPRRSVSDPTGERPKAKDVEADEEIDSGQFWFDYAMEMTQSSKSSKSEDTQAKPILKAPTTKPAPISVRKRVSFDNEEPTVRPSQGPDAALADVIACSKGELAKLTRERRATQALYDNLDPTTGRRKHRDALLRIHDLDEQIDIKRKQLYDCQDILEGQKAYH